MIFIIFLPSMCIFLFELSSINVLLSAVFSDFLERFCYELYVCISKDKVSANNIAR
ncbi:hypothetical protein GMES_4378 [Paraglaciecola mesophila KMM 241]|uniref:Uncharacterized protein n=1 Tax=Paraglaciecola mesophila KMM 241 TaxID=1128912 RepID=K6Y1D1_9ALTE|nr:hypothetical protein GMES_4378 [Paraglaciecola mesophila KMM 241]